jgi:hypothetical protein
MSALILYSLLSAALFYLGSRAIVTRWLWSRYPPRFASFMDCAACTGAWLGAILATVLGRHVPIDVFELSALAWYTPIVVGLCMIVLTPIVAGLMQRGLDSLGSAIVE